MLKGKFRDLRLTVVAFGLHDINFTTCWPDAVSVCVGHHPVVDEHKPKNGSTETYQIAGHSQLPAGSFATTSTLPYRMVCLP